MTIAYANLHDARPLNLGTLKFTTEQFYQLCLANPDRSLELTATGELIVMPPVGGESGKRELNLGSQLFNWNQNMRLGETFSSSTVFRLPLGSQRSPDAAWVELSRWNALTDEEREKFPPLAPDFAILLRRGYANELRSRTDLLSDLQAKMVEYRDNGVRLGLLINPQDRQVEIYRLNREVEVLQSPTSIDCDLVLPGFILNLIDII